MTVNAFHNISKIEDSLWEAADQLRANSKLTSSEYCMPVLGVTYHFRENAIKSMVGSSGRQRVQETCFHKIMVFVPPPSLLRLFSEFAEHSFEQIESLHAQNHRLCADRDFLLPRLNSGELVA